MFNDDVMKDYVQFLKSTDYTQEEIAQKLGINKRTLQNYLYGKNMPKNIEKLIDLVFSEDVDSPKENETLKILVTRLKDDMVQMCEKLEMKDQLIKSLETNISLLESRADIFKFNVTR
jgi:transcriptional regulator with XRE-family HTH domain